MKLDIPKFRYLFQDLDGEVIATVQDTSVARDRWYWNRPESHFIVSGGKMNSNWRNTRIDLETDEYEFEDGILRRVEK